ncbi:MAG: hypothetical protein ACTSVM_02335 [Candidatus Ranarchaeia archaeon]
MPGSRKTIVYFERSGPVNTDETIRLAKERALELGIKQVVVPSRTGATALKTVEALRGTRIQTICVSSPSDTHLQLSLLEKWGTFEEIPELKSLIQRWREEKLTRVPHSISPETAERLKKVGATVLYGRTAWRRPPFSAKIDFPGLKTLGQAILLAIRLVSTGVEVAVKTAIIAVEANAVSPKDEIISLGGVERGVDTAIVMRPPSEGVKIFDEVEGLDIREIICKPRTGMGASGRLLERVSPI